MKYENKIEKIIRNTFFVYKDKKNKLSAEVTARWWIYYLYYSVFAVIFGLGLLVGGILLTVNGVRYQELSQMGSGIATLVGAVICFGAFYFAVRDLARIGSLFIFDRTKRVEKAKEYIQYREFLLAEAKIIDEKWKQLQGNLS